MMAEGDDHDCGRNNVSHTSSWYIHTFVFDLLQKRGNESEIMLFIIAMHCNASVFSFYPFDHCVAHLLKWKSEENMEPANMMTIFPNFFWSTAFTFLWPPSNTASSTDLAKPEAPGKPRVLNCSWRHVICTALQTNAMKSTTFSTVCLTYFSV